MPPVNPWCRPIGSGEHPYPYSRRFAVSERYPRAQFQRSCFGQRLPEEVASSGAEAGIGISGRVNQDCQDAGSVGAAAVGYFPEPDPFPAEPEPIVRLEEPAPLPRVADLKLPT